ncbi:D-alanyl-D-alanine carboxypeptidase precursor [compost metagenome]
MTLAAIKQTIEAKLKAVVDSNPKVPNAFFLLHSEKLNVHWNLAYGQSDGQPVHADQPYHAASIGKAFTGVLIAMLAEEGKLNFQDPISKYLSDDILNGLHVYKGKDYSREILIEHLLGNTSGLPDFYEEKPKDGKRFLQRLLEDPSLSWTPQETILFSKENLKPRFAPGKGCHYTNTGFNLLGLIIEHVTGKPYHEALHDSLFQRLGMRHSYLLQYAQPAEKSRLPVANVYALGTIVKADEHLSFAGNYAAGQSVSTSEDLFAFMKVLVEGGLLKPETLAKMQQWKKMWVGVDYGLGLERVRMVPFLKQFDVWGHLGSIGSFMLYNPTLDLYLVGNFNSSGYLTQSIRFVFTAMQRLSKFSKSLTRAESLGRKAA